MITTNITHTVNIIGAFDIYYCTYDFGHDSAYEDSLTWTHYYDGTSPNTGDTAQPHSGQFSTATGFNFELTGLPAEPVCFVTSSWPNIFSPTACALPDGTI